MSQAVADGLRGQHVAVVSNCYTLAPWGDVLVSQDIAWWTAHPDAFRFVGRKFSTNRIEGVERFEPSAMVNEHFGTGCNSGLLACMVAQWMGAKRIYLHGFDLHGDHFFGLHKAPLKNPDANRFKGMRDEFRMWRHTGVDVINMTPGSALTCFASGVS
jgi:hypothetical protein